ncbi:MAG TPA: S8 family serine peptidase [Bacteroidia bacterium]|nr:S8 family serine peptidase [Bacteroidia bacterium]
MKKLLLLLSLAFIGEITNAQQVTFWVQFTDKNNSPYSISNPSAYLSPRALTRRTTQAIPVDSFDLPVNPAYLAGVAATGAQVHARSKWLNGCVVLASNPAQITAISALPYVSNVTGVGARVGHFSNKLDEATAPLDPNARVMNEQTNSLNYGMSFNQINMLGGVCLHNAGYRGQGMQIAIIDAGFLHADTLSVFDTLWAHNRILGTWDFVNNEQSVYEDNAHGAMVLSTMGGNKPGQLIGTAPEASYWLLRSEEAATEYVVEEYYWAAAAEFADSVGADVINSSLGYTEFDDPSENHVYADLDGHTVPCARAANFAARKGICVVVSAGNSGQSSWFYIGTPADADSALTIAAVDASGAVAGFSSRGSMTLFHHQKPSTAAQGVNAVIVDPNSGNIQTGSGTSFSSPITCGLVACLLQAHPNMGCMQVLQTIEQSASQFSSPDSLMGYGIPDFCTANLLLSGNTSAAYSPNTICNISPNPFTDNFHFSFFATNDQLITIRMYDMQGKLVMERKENASGNSMNSYTIGELENFAAGIYSLQIVGTDVNFVQKMVKE